jgi:uncharacterized protein YjdB
MFGSSRPGRSSFGSSSSARSSSARFGVRALLLAVLAVPFFGCGSSSDVNSITISPTTISLGVGATAQLTALATINHGAHPSSQSNITNTATWASSIAGVATVSSSGVVTAVSAGTTTITASTTGFGGAIVSNQAAITVTGATTGGASSELTALAIIPSTQSVNSPGQTSQFIAIGTTSAGATVNLTNSSTWSSSSQQVATITSTGLATATGKGTSTITAIATNADNTVVTASASFTVIGGASEPYTALSITPTSETLSATGQTGQLLAVATSGSTGLQQDVTNSPQVLWSSSIPTIATVSTSPASPAGQVAGASPGTTQITAKLTNPDGTVLTASANITVTASSQAEPLLSITILPVSVSTGNLNGTGQFLAYGTFSTPPTVQDITNGITRNGFTSPVTWISDLQTEFPVTTASGPVTYPPTAPLTDGGLVTAYASGNTSIYVTAQNPDGTLVYSPAVNFACPYVAPTAQDVGSCNPETIADPLLVTLTVFNAGLNTSNWLVTAPSATGTPNVIHCGPGSVAAGLGASVCSAPYPVNTAITLTAPAESGVSFGGWSYNCSATVAVNAPGPNKCTVTVGNDGSATNPTSNVSVGAIFNN